MDYPKRFRRRGGVNARKATVRLPGGGDRPVSKMRECALRRHVKDRWSRLRGR